MSNTIQCAPSLLSANFASPLVALRQVEASGASWLHLDIMDGVFVPPITFGEKMVEDIRRETSLFLDVHLMTVHPERHVAAFMAAGADAVTFHPEIVVHSHRLIEEIQRQGKRAGIALVPSTSITAIEELLPYVDLILIMTVNPGYGGQKMIPSCLEKVKTLDALRKKRCYRYLISVDGGINEKTIGEVKKARADLFVAGSAIFSSDAPAKEIKRLTEGPTTTSSPTGISS